MVQLRTAPAIDFVLEKYQDEFMGKVHQLRPNKPTNLNTYFKKSMI